MAASTNRTMAVNSGARVWGPFRQLYDVINMAVFKRQPEAIHDLDVALRKHKPDFVSLLQNPARSTHLREMVKKATTDGLQVSGEQRSQTFSQQFVDEAIIISDMLQLNELAAVELLMAGENQQSDFPGLTRGLVAVVLYYDGRRSLINSLRALLQSRDGRTWTLGLSDELVSLTTRFTDQLVEEGLTNKILDLIATLDVTKELDRLQKERAIGGAKHRKQVMDLIKEIRLSLAECLFCLSCQQPLSRVDTLRLITHLKADTSVRSDGTLEPVSLCLLMTLLYCLDVNVVEQEDSAEVLQNLPIIADAQYIVDIHREIRSEQKWALPGMKATVQFAWAITLREIAQFQTGSGVSDYCEEDEVIIDMALADNVFSFLHVAVVRCDEFHNEEFYLRVLHTLMTDFLFYMPLKWKELRNRGDETARIIQAHEQEGMEPPVGLKNDFEQMLRLIASIYEKDPLSLQLALDYWCPADGTNLQDSLPMNNTAHYRPPQRQVSLHKFVRLAGDLLPPSLYIPYINMLAGLANGPQCAQHCFNLLRTNSLGPGAPASMVSWDHIFMSLNQYYMGLRKESQGTLDQSGSAAASLYRAAHLRGITPQEMQGLLSVLKLTRCIAEQCEMARVALCESQHWNIIVLMFGLVTCSISPLLKAELLLLLAAFGRTTELATNLWQSLEVSQILPTAVSGRTSEVGGIQAELEEVESRAEEYPLTQAFLTLLNTLTNIPVPSALGVGFRAPGFEPYLSFVRDHILLKFPSRAYKDAGEKWKVASLSLELIHKLLREHTISVHHFMDEHVETPSGTVTANKAPGHSLMLHLLNDTGLLRIVLYILHDGVKLLEQYTALPGQKALENSCLLCLKIVETVLDKETLFLDTLRESGTSPLVTPMDKLLMAINPRSGKADHLANIAKYVTFGSFLTEHALSAMQVLYMVSKSPTVQAELVGLFTADETISREILAGFVECLEVEESEPMETQIPDNEDQTDVSRAQVSNSTRRYLLQLLLHTLDQRAPNLAHYLLGFELRKPVSKTNLQDPGVLGSPKTCLHAILSFLDRGTEQRQGPRCLLEAPRLAELCYQLIYILCANRDTAMPVMRYLRTTRDFLYRHLEYLPLNPEDYSGNAVTNHQSWLLKSVAIELRLTSLNRQRSNIQRLMTLLLDDSIDDQAADVTSVDGELSYLDPDQTMNDTRRSRTTRNVAAVQKRRKILCILDSLTFQQPYPDQLQLEFFDPRLIEQVITNCEQKTEQGITYYNVKTLHSVLSNEMNNIQGTSLAGQRPLIMQEIENVLNTVVKRNTVRQGLHSKRQSFEAWRQVVEVLLTACPEELLSGEIRQNVLFELLQDLLLKVSDTEALPELTAPVARVILTLLAALRQCFLLDQSDDTGIARTGQYVNPLDSTVSTSITNVTQTLSAPSGSRTLFATSLQVVLKGLIEYILRASGGQQSTRANLYGALLYFLQIAQKPKVLPSLPSDAEAGSHLESLLTRQVNEYEVLAKENLSTMLSYGDAFMDIVCRDACDGHDVGRMLALSVLDGVVGLDKYSQWLQQLTNKGYLQHLVSSLVADDQQLQAVLSLNREPLRALYIYQSKMSLFQRIAMSASGAQILLQCGLIDRLAECAFFDLRPDIDRHHKGDGDLLDEDDEFLPSPLSRYRLLLSAALRLCLAILTSLGIEHRQAGKQVMQFVVAHIDVFHGILRDKHAMPSVATLRELALTTAVLGRAAYHGDMDIEIFASESAALEYRGHVARIQRLLMTLLPRFCYTEKLNKQLKNLEQQCHSDQQHIVMEIHLLIEEVLANVMSFSRSLVTQSGTSAKYCRILFGPSLEEALARDISTADFQTVSLSASQSPSLGLLIYQLKKFSEQFSISYDHHKQHHRKLHSLSDLSTTDLKELSGFGGNEKMSAQQKQAIAAKRLRQIVCYKARQLEHYSYTIENALFLVWRHLEYYLIHCVPVDSQPSLYQVHVSRQKQIRRLQDFSNMSMPRVQSEDEDLPDSLVDSSNRGVTHDQIDQLKHDVVSALSDTLLKKLQEISQMYGRSRSQYGFTEALIRRIKRLLKLHTGTV